MTNENTTGTIKIQSHLEMRKPIRIKIQSHLEMRKPIRLKSLSQKNPDEAKYTKDSMRRCR